MSLQCCLYPCFFQYKNNNYVKISSFLPTCNCFVIRGGLLGQSECGCFGPNTVSIDAGTGMTPEQLGLPANWFSPNPDPVPSCISISGHLIIPNDWFQNFAGIDEIIMQPGASIEIMGHWQKEHAGHLRFSGNNVHGCNQMWRGITVNGGAHLQLFNSTIADAQSAASFLFNGTIGNAHLDNCQDMLFLNNHIGLDDNPSNGAYSLFMIQSFDRKEICCLLSTIYLFTIVKQVLLVFF